ncbi:MAG: glycosyltransferase family 39 protein, partial [bacterium]|nr:glycosyltransferase family 39 protein [bacterium]
MPSFKDKELLIVTGLLLVASYLLLTNLGNQYLWQDEAQTALIAKTVITHMVPLGYDGKNYFSQDWGAEYGNNCLWRYHTWLPFYLLALFFKLFKISTYTARLPFALLGTATVLLTYFFGKHLWNSKKAGLAAATLLLLSVPFLIVSRQCRYYSPTIFLSLLALFTYLKYTSGNRRAIITFAVSSILLFQSHYI